MIPVLVFLLVAAAGLLGRSSSSGYAAGVGTPFDDLEVDCG